jgi:hypothetical protein
MYGSYSRSGKLTPLTGKRAEKRNWLKNRTWLGKGKPRHLTVHDFPQSLFRERQKDNINFHEQKLCCMKNNTVNGYLERGTVL